MTTTTSRTAIVTGGSSGIGYAVAAALLKRGDNVVISGRDAAKLASAATELGAGDRLRHLVADLTDERAGQALVDTAVDAFGSVDILVNNAGTFASAPFVDVTPADLDHFLTGNLRGTYLITQAVARRMIDQALGGAIVNITTVLLSHGITGFPVTAPMVSKGGVRALTVSLSAELAPYGIRVNEVAPGIVRTPLHSGSDVDALGALAVLDRVAEPAEIADSVLHLTDSTFLTGTVIAADGGYVTARP
ncbi:SDR family NAD(P)-dependent oxidoreductase [Nocardia yamanashiensis]|uniref:SDR family NAD(P)-dependent oxidoreductase n=1 Tax=Nocardia yamanashiensis TaxID=209247 RepID=UPI00082D6AE6|nr:SDR family oxidoreductase [Nocardia yamanashiensis]